MFFCYISAEELVLFLLYFIWFHLSEVDGVYCSACSGAGVLSLGDGSEGKGVLKTQ